MINFGPTFIWTAVNLLVLYVALRLILFKPVTQFMKNRTKSIKDALEEAEKNKAEAMELKRKYQEQLHAARAEAESIINEARVRGDREYDAIVTNALKHADDIITKANRDIERDKEQAFKEVRNQVASLALIAASKVIEANMDTESNRALVRKFLDEVGAA